MKLTPEEREAAEAMRLRRIEELRQPLRQPLPSTTADPGRPV